MIIAWTAYERGRKDFKKGLAMEDNPFRWLRNGAAPWWEKGWIDAKNEPPKAPRRKRDANR